jgi:hypothetical protein
MTKAPHQVATRHQDQDRDASADQRSAGQPATAMVREMLATGGMDPKPIAAIIDEHPAAMNEILALLHSTVGNRFANEVSALIGKGELRAPRDVVTFDRPGEYMEPRATIEGPPRDRVSSDTFGEYRESRATIEGPPRDGGSSDTFGDYRESRATIEGPTKDAAAPNHEARWVTGARSFNRAQAKNVTVFLEMTGTTCVDESTGEADPHKVARWQADHGIPPDGRVGDHTVDAAALTIGRAQGSLDQDPDRG